MDLSEQDQAELHSLLKSQTYDGSVSVRAQIVLWYGEGYRKVEIVTMSGTTRPTVDKWLKRYEKYGVEGLVSRASPGGPRQIPDRIRARILALTRTTPPSALGISHWSSTEMARYIKKTEGVYVSQTWVSRLWRENGLRPWQQGTFKISKDPDFEEKVCDVVGLYLTPPEGEAVVSVDVNRVSRPWTALSRCCRLTSTRPRNVLLTTRARGPRICTPRWMSGPVK